jgi:hypothetical protein
VDRRSCFISTRLRLFPANSDFALMLTAYHSRVDRGMPHKLKFVVSGKHRAALGEIAAQLPPSHRRSSENSIKLWMGWRIRLIFNQIVDTPNVFW